MTMPPRFVSDRAVRRIADLDAEDIDYWRGRGCLVRSWLGPCARPAEYVIDYPRRPYGPRCELHARKYAQQHGLVLPELPP